MEMGTRLVTFASQFRLELAVLGVNDLLRAYLGHGWNGIVFRGAENAVKVIRAKDDNSELDAALFFASYGDTQPPGITHIKDVYALRGGSDTVKAYAIVREELTALRIRGMNETLPTPVFGDAVTDMFVEMALNLLMDETNTTDRDLIRRRRMEYLNLKADIEDPPARKFLQQAETLRDFCHAYRIVLFDIAKLEQWGIREDGTYALLDLGLLDVPVHISREHVREIT